MYLPAVSYQVCSHRPCTKKALANRKSFTHSIASFVLQSPPQFLSFHPTHTPLHLRCASPSPHLSTTPPSRTHNILLPFPPSTNHHLTSHPSSRPPRPKRSGHPQPRTSHRKIANQIPQQTRQLKNTRRQRQKRALQPKRKVQRKPYRPEICGSEGETRAGDEVSDVGHGSEHYGPGGEEEDGA